MFVCFSEYQYKLTVMFYLFIATSLFAQNVNSCDYIEIYFSIQLKLMCGDIMHIVALT